VSAAGLSSAFAGQCPADQVKQDAREPVTVAAKGVTDTTLGAIDLSKEPYTRRLDACARGGGRREAQRNL
jgi:hypothetical protein